MGVNEGFADRRARAALQHRRLHRHDDQRQHRHQPRPIPRCSRCRTITRHGADGSADARRISIVNGQTSRSRHAAVAASARWSASSTRRSGDRYLFSGTAIDTPRSPMPTTSSTAPRRRPGLKSRSWPNASRPISAPTAWAGWCIAAADARRSVQVAEDVAGSPFGLKMSRGLLDADRRRRSPARAARRPSFSVDLNGVNPERWRPDQRSLHAARWHRPSRST